ncbi:radical SAM domain-containing protein [Candidatus Magnetoovum chiemensis]|nr:radical SAM domain-containing protein [Candidatus Magnetoovum chiemensis]
MSFKDKILSSHGKVLRASKIDTLQVNVGYKCNLSCKHCHVDAGSNKEEIMNLDTIKKVINVLKSNNIALLDITGGAPELNPHLRYLIEGAKSAVSHILLRTNLTIYEDNNDSFLKFYRDNCVELIASLPNYLEEPVDRVRGGGVFAKSISILKQLNALGYGGDELKLNLVYNPQGAILAPKQDDLEASYKKELYDRYNIVFNRLYTICNVPLGRFKEFLIRTNNFENYMNRLICAFNSETLDKLMCRSLISLGYDGSLYDCDFNQAAAIPITDGYPKHIDDFDIGLLSERQIALGDHCYSCTAGQGST